MYSEKGPNTFASVWKYCIAGYFRGENFSQIELFPAFQGKNFHELNSSRETRKKFPA